MSAIKVECPKCNSTDVTIKLTDCICNNCGEKFKAPLGVYADVIDGKNLGFTPLSWRTESMTKWHNEMREKWELESKKARLKALQFNWEKKGTQIPLIGSLMFAGLSVIASVSYSSYLATPFIYVSIASGLTYIILELYRRLTSKKKVKLFDLVSLISPFDYESFLNYVH